MQTYYRVDQEELEKRGMAHKSELSKESGGLNHMHKFSMLQRFRQNKDFKAPDRYRPKVIDGETDIKALEDQWYKNNAQT